MSEAKTAIIDDVDFGQLYRDHQRLAGGWVKPPAFWDERAQAFDARQRSGGHYIETFVSWMDLSDCDSLIDIGCGNGALPIALAPRLNSVIALDYSPAMLDVARRRAAEAGVGNMQTVLRAWEEDWSDLPQCDIAIASRSTGVMDLEAALRKLDAQARKRVYLTAPVGSRAVNRSVLEALGRPAAPAVDKPDYIYFVNLVHRMNRMPRVDFIAHPGSEPPEADWAGFQRNAAFFLGELSEAEWARLRAWRERHPEAPLFERDQKFWAFISWSK
jgi:SAM-dependent methyltransferase